MDNSRKPRADWALPAPSERLEASRASVTIVPDAKLVETLASQLASVRMPASARAIHRVGVAFSGGPDSSALAICAAYWAQKQSHSVTLLHIHHGLMPEADQWVERGRALADLLGLPWVLRHVQVDLTRTRGLEGAAREARHRALQQLASEQGLDAVLFGHHLQDQAETVLQRLLRGSGVLGLAAMKAANWMTFADDAGAGGAGCWWLRPWLGVPRSRIMQCVTDFEVKTGWHAVHDASNLDVSYARGVIRSQLAGPISAHWPAWATNLARHAELAQEASELLSEYGALLLEKVADEAVEHAVPVLDLRRWRALSLAQQSLVLRTWFLKAGALMPTQHRLAELCRQLNQVHAFGHDRDLLWRQNDCVVTCSRGRIYLQVTIVSFGPASRSALK